MSTSEHAANLFQSVRKWRTRLSPIGTIIILGIFLYWTWTHWDRIATTFKSVGGFNVVFVALLIETALILSVFTFTILVKDKGYSFRFLDGYHALNLSQLASMIPGKVWGFAGLAGLLWSRGISKLDSVFIIVLNTLVMLSACAIIGVSGLVAIFGWEYASICVLPFLVLVLGRNQLEKILSRYFPVMTSLPSTWRLLAVLVVGVLVWLIVSTSFTWFLYLSEGAASVPFWTVAGAYAAGYLGGFLSMIAPSGLGVSEGLIALILGPYLGTETVISIAISFRFIQTFVIWCNILLTLAVTSMRAR